MKYQAGDTVALTRCRVWVSTEDSTPQERYMSGLFQLENWEPRDPAAYQWESGWVIFPIGLSEVRIDSEPVVLHDQEGLCLFASDSDLFEQIDPKGYGHMLRAEREMEFWMEQEEEAFTKAHAHSPSNRLMNSGHSIVLQATGGNRKHND